MSTFTIFFRDTEANSIAIMRQFADNQGNQWTASVSRADGPDYKGRYVMVLENDSGQSVALEDIRWNTEKTAYRTLQTMSDVELRRRLRSAAGRSAAQESAST